ncbi:proline--tRNA ligase [Anaerosinus massiliensis]|uniref:proline--tRNA ligase n=1 Tax=Massilibacillus massiliensis TaxID=1806837 RepID=UPI000B08D471|nr:proline--tRNA ligase [Massilibacillus massiliensis]
MRTTQLYAPTLRETPADAEVVSHQLMLRAGLIRKAAGGVYTYLPLAWRVLKKIETIVREEMDAAGGQELAMPIMQPAELWHETGRWDVYGDEMFRLKDRHARSFCLGPTHEEMITSLVRSDVRSYRQLPLMLYQIQNKYRDEIRPRFGLMRGREFIMKDLYSFDKDEAGLDISYQKMYNAYTKIFSRCGLNFRAVEADGGAIGGSNTHEFMVIAESGEAGIVYCNACDYAANVEKAELKPLMSEAELALPLEIIDTPDTKTIESLATFLNVDIKKTIKAVAFQNEKEEVVLAFVRGDHEVNDIKLQNAVGAIALTMATDQAIREVGGVPGFMSPVGIQGAKIVVDHTVMEMCNAIGGANIEDKHYKNLNPKRDFKDVIVTDLRLIEKGDPCPHCGAPLETARGIEAGQVFKLGTKYSEALKATFLDENGREKPMVMGCYGVGVSRTMAAAIEQNFDEHGIIWPVAIAPYMVAVVPINAKDEEQMIIAEELYANLQRMGIETILDDRKERAGVKFKDADLIGYPLRITVGPKAVNEDTIELKVRRSGDTLNYTRSNCLDAVKKILADLS